YPKITAVFGREWVPGVDNDSHLTILHTPLQGLLGYYSSSDEYPRQVHQFSNQREMIYIDSTNLLPGTSRYLGTLAHELTHAIQWRADRTENTWIDEGLAEIGKKLAGYPSLLENAFLASPSISLINWPVVSSETQKHYGGASLFMEYLAQRYSYESLRVLQDHPANGIAGVEGYLQNTNSAISFNEVFGDWIVANYLDEPGNGRYSYNNRDVQVAVIDVVRINRTITGNVPQYGARYFKLKPAEKQVNIAFRGQRLSSIFTQDPPSGSHCWWSNKGESIDSTLTAQFELPHSNNLTLSYSLWYDIEESYDYAYTQVSTDGGETWEILQGNHSSMTNPVGNSFGPGYTGKSNGWIRDEIDLRSYAGQRVLIRFEYVTDNSLHGTGICLDDIAISSIGFLENAESKDTRWKALGFKRTKNSFPQKYLVKVIEVGAKNRVIDLWLDENQEGDIHIEGFGSSLDHAVVIVAGLDRISSSPATFEIDFGAPG
ncbi:MAG: hypothetical protein BZY82_00920, partial [SAR202 cluster bacterium Io17-Chloro-G3]